MGILDRAKQHFSDIETQSLEVPEWDLTLYWRPWTVNERQKVWGAVKMSGKDTEISSRTLITKALDKDGKNLFGIGDLRALNSDVDFAVLERVAMAIIGIQPDEADVIKN